MKITRENLRMLGFTNVLREDIGKYDQHWYVATKPSQDLRIAISLGQYTSDDTIYFTLEGSWYFRGRANFELLYTMMTLNNKK